MTQLMTTNMSGAALAAMLVVVSYLTTQKTVLQNKFLMVKAGTAVRLKI